MGERTQCDALQAVITAWNDKRGAGRARQRMFGRCTRDSAQVDAAARRRILRMYRKKREDRSGSKKGAAEAETKEMPWERTRNCDRGRHTTPSTADFGRPTMNFGVHYIVSRTPRGTLTGTTQREFGT